MADTHAEKNITFSAPVEKTIRDLNQFSPENSKTLKETPYEQLIAILLRRKAEQKGPDFSLDDALAEIQKLQDSLANAKRITLTNLHTDLVGKQMEARQAQASPAPAQ